MNQNINFPASYAMVDRNEMDLITGGATLDLSNISDSINKVTSYLFAPNGLLVQTLKLSVKVVAATGVVMTNMLSALVPFASSVVSWGLEGLNSLFKYIGRSAM